MLVIFRLKSKTRPGIQANIFTCLLDQAYDVPLANIKIESKRWPGKLLILVRAGMMYVAMGTEMLSFSRGAHLVAFYCKKSYICDTNWPRYLSSSYLINFG